MFGRLNNPDKRRSKSQKIRSSRTLNNVTEDMRYRNMWDRVVDGPRISMRNMREIQHNNTSKRMPSRHSLIDHPERINYDSFISNIPYISAFNNGSAKRVFASRRDQSHVHSSMDFPVRFCSPGTSSFLDIVGIRAYPLCYAEYMFDGPSADIIYENFRESNTSEELSYSGEETQNESQISSVSISVGNESNALNEIPSPKDNSIPECILTPQNEDLPSEESAPVQAVVCVKPSRSSCRRNFRPYSRTQTIDCVEFPKGEEMTDELTVGHLGVQAKQALEMAREQRIRERRPRQQDPLKEPFTQEGVHNKKDLQVKMDSMASQNRPDYLASDKKAKEEEIKLGNLRQGKEIQEGEANANRMFLGTVGPPVVQPKGLANHRNGVDTNHVHTLVVVESMMKGNEAITCKDAQVSYDDQVFSATEVKKRKEGALECSSQTLQQLCTVASKGFNVALLSSEAPNTSSRFISPVWQALTQIVRKVLADHTDDKGCIEPDFELSCALGYILNDKCRDIFTEEDKTFEKITIKTSPIIGANLQELQYYRFKDATTFEEHLSSSLARANANSILSTLMEGFVGAFLNVRQGLWTENREKDICLSSIIVTSAGCDVKPYMDSLNLVHNSYGSIFHLAVLGPCFSCYMLNIADDDTVKQSAVPSGSSIPAELGKLFSLLKKMSETENLPLRSGSVRRFLTYLKHNYEKTRERLNTENLKDDKRSRLEKFLVETNTLMEMYAKILFDSEDKSK